jgi:hypothetical protein
MAVLALPRVRRAADSRGPASSASGSAAEVSTTHRNGSPLAYLKYQFWEPNLRGRNQTPHVWYRQNNLGSGHQRGPGRSGGGQGLDAQQAEPAAEALRPRPLSTCCPGTIRRLAGFTISRRAQFTGLHSHSVLATQSKCLYSAIFSQHKSPTHRRQSMNCYPLMQILQWLQPGNWQPAGNCRMSGSPCGLTS